MNINSALPLVSLIGISALFFPFSDDKSNITPIPIVAAEPEPEPETFTPEEITQNPYIDPEAGFYEESGPVGEQKKETGKPGKQVLNLQGGAAAIINRTDSWDALMNSSALIIL